MVALGIGGSAPALGGGDVTVFAASSLKDAFSEIGTGFEKRHPHAHVRFSFAGSQTLAAQIRQGAPADVFAGANWKSFEDAGLAKGSGKVFARNRMVIVLRRGYGGVRRYADLSRVGRLVLADERVPAGQYAMRFLDRAAAQFGGKWKDSVLARVVSREADVRSVLAKVQLGEADAGIVYASDASSAKSKVVTVGIPDSLNPIAEYPMATLGGSAAGKAFANYVLSREGQAILVRHGFLKGVPDREKAGREGQPDE